jgi:MoaA/NifB/PqqE/SkfB family radical SAM enzyme
MLAPAINSGYVYINAYGWIEFPELAGERAYFEGGACDIDHYAMFVNYNGDVWQCFSRDIIAGNVEYETLKGLWNSPQLIQLREKPVDSSCGMCPGRRYNLEKYRKLLPLD